MLAKWREAEADGLVRIAVEVLCPYGLPSVRSVDAGRWPSDLAVLIKMPWTYRR
jgi:hypothetical protein